MLSDDTDKFIVDLCKTITLFILITGLILFKAFVFLKMWAWFIIPSFTSAPVLNYPKTIGIMGLIGLIIYHKNPKDDDSAFMRLLNGYLYVTLSLFIGWIVNMFM